MEEARKTEADLLTARGWGWGEEAAVGGKAAEDCACRGGGLW